MGRFLLPVGYLSTVLPYSVLSRVWSGRGLSGIHEWCCWIRVTCHHRAVQSHSVWGFGLDPTAPYPFTYSTYGTYVVSSSSGLTSPDYLGTRTAGGFGLPALSYLPYYTKHLLHSRDVGSVAVSKDTRD
ncbi:hypothetical protein F5B22DRAFT_405934 [Xylaria bambusicola]|uniref:uncharacterized protein n=1 Tax=Xylaria bambusicola TaxID=326684 RepID=UPI0020087CCA|nr:uncharacterized protein F5B22DRAFT_405934 [Xylaria bambusicola]KAI0523629.1 hypothetical protein F5B22DRAFT_405934 [Xylaria bambusicola]